MSSAVRWFWIKTSLPMKTGRTTLVNFRMTTYSRHISIQYRPLLQKFRGNRGAEGRRKREEEKYFIFYKTE